MAVTGAVEGRLAEAWVQVRTLHSPVKVATSASALYSLDGMTKYGVTFGLECSHCQGLSLLRSWPCPTARIVYGDREIAAALAGTPPEDQDTHPEGDE